MLFCFSLLCARIQQRAAPARAADRQRPSSSCDIATMFSNRQNKYVSTFTQAARNAMFSYNYPHSHIFFFLFFFSRTAAAAQETANEPETLDDLSRKLAVDLRKHVRRLEGHPMFSRDWIGMVDSLVHISNIAQMEHRLPRSGDGTLWEGDELTVRFLLEEGKLNLCLRLMHDFCRAVAAMQPPSDAYASFLAERAAAAELPDADAMQQKLLTFEQAMGVLLRCAFEHVEAVQTTDLPELCDHAGEVFRACAWCKQNLQPRSQVHVFGSVQLPRLAHDCLQTGMEQSNPVQPSAHLQTSGAMQVPLL